MQNIESKYKKQLNFLFDFLAGGLSGAISKTMNAPIERVKLILQTESDNKQVKKQYKGILDCFQRCIKEEGFFSLWRGNVTNCIRYFPTQALNFSFKEQINEIFGLNSKISQNNSNFMYLSVLSGGIAGCLTVFFVYPLDFARTRLGVDMGANKSGERQFKGLFDCLNKVYASDGIRGLYRGLNSCLLGIFVYRGLYFGIYDGGKKIWMSQEREKSIIMRLIFAQLVVMTSETISYPLDTIKRRMMMQSARGEILYKNSFQCTKKIYEKEGVRGFFKGAFSNLIRGYGSAICLVLFDEFKKLNQYNK